MRIIIALAIIAAIVILAIPYLFVTTRRRQREKLRRRGIKTYGN